MLDDNEYMKAAIEQAKKSLLEGGIPIGAVLVSEEGEIISSGHNRRVQEDDPLAHGEMDCIRRAGRIKNYKGTSIYTTLSPCMMCSGTIVQFGISRVVIGENLTFGGNENFLKVNGVDVTILDNAECKQMMSEFVNLNPDLWNEDIGA